MVGNQAYLFLVFSLTGIFVGCLFDFFRVLRKLFKTSNLITYIEDILFWILTGIIILYTIWYFNDGEIRFYLLLGLIMGIIIYILIISEIYFKILFKVLKIIKKTLSLIITPIFLFFSKIYNIILRKVEKIIKKIINLSNKRGKIEKNEE